jgi:hypothetical protein
MPDKFKPEVCGVILHLEENNENEYFAIINAPSEPSAEYLSWAITFARSKNINIVWYVDDRGWWLGNEEFCKQMELKHSSSDPIKK